MSQMYRALSTRWREALHAIADRHGLPFEELQGKQRFKPHVEARRECYRYLQAEGWSTPEIGGLFNRDHTTVVIALLDSAERRAIARQRTRHYAHKLGARRVA